MESNGFVKVHRKIMDNPIIFKDSDHFAVWMYLLLNATHKEMDMLFKGKRITLIPGQLITGRKVISTKLGIEETKVKRIINLFKNAQQIDQQASNKNSLITIKNWVQYQQVDQQNAQQVPNKCPTDAQQVPTNKNVKNDKNVKKKDIYGTYGNVLLADNEREELVLTYGEDMTLKSIQYLDEYIEMKGYKAKSHCVAIKVWVYEAVKKRDLKVTPITASNKFNNFPQREYDMRDVERRLLQK